MVLLDIGEAASHFLPLGVLVKRVLNVLLCLFNGSHPGVEAGMLHLLIIVAHVLVIVATGREGHTSSLMAARHFFIGLLLIVVDVARISQSAEERAAPIQHAWVGAHGKVPADPSLHSR